MFHPKTLAIALLGAALVALCGTPAMAQAPSPQGSVAAIVRPGHPERMMNRRMRMRRRRRQHAPLMRRAWRSLTMAERALGKARPVFGGHRVKALALVRQAKEELRRAARYAKEHSREKLPQKEK